MVGRATLYGLISGGQAGVQHAIEHNVGIYCLASPIAVRSEVVGAIGVAGRSKEALKPHIQTVQHTAQVISHILSRGS